MPPGAFREAVRTLARRTHRSPRTATTSCQSSTRFILFHHNQHLATMGADAIRASVTSLAIAQPVAAAPHNGAVRAVLLRYRAVRHRDLTPRGALPRAQRPWRLPVVCTRTEVQALLAQLSGTYRNGPRITQAAGGGGCCYMVGMDTPVNILDVVYDAEAAGGWLPNQVQHAIGQLSLLLGTPGSTPDGRDRLVPRTFSPEEAGVLDRALTRLYQGVSPSAPLEQMPLLSDLIAQLGVRREAEAQRLARQLRLKLFGSADPTEQELTTLGCCFNAHTQVDWRFSSDITSYNTASVPQLYRPFFYLQIIGAVLRFMRDPRRDRQRKTILAIDEFGYVTQIEALARLAATITKVARKYAIGLIVIDQNPQTFLDSETGRAIFENCAAKVAFRLDEAPARQLAGAIRGMQEHHITALTRFAPGQCLAVVRNDVYVLNVETSPRELRAFQGS